MREVSALAPVRLKFCPLMGSTWLWFLRRECPFLPLTRYWEVMPDDLQVKVAALTHSITALCLQS